MQSFFHQLHKTKLDAMRAAAPRATLHLLHESNGFSAYLSEAAAAQKVCPQFGTITNHAEDEILDEPVLHLFIPMEQMERFVEEMAASQSVALVDVILPGKVHAARYVQYAYFPKQRSYPDPAMGLNHFNPGPEALRIMEKQIDDDPDFWG